MWGRVAAAMVAVLLAVSPAAADEIGNRIEAARTAYQKTDFARTARELEAALVQLQQRLGSGLAEYMPAAPSGWQADKPEIQGLGAVGGGLSVVRAYTKGDASLNASVILDSPAVEAAAALLGNPAATAAQPKLRRVKAGGEDALMRWDGQARSGEISIVLSNRVLLQIEGDNIANGDLLMEAAKGWNVAGIRKLIGL
ncbi:MAG: hypothetical protein HY985_13580 [Magnetospirillum sp.]|nr:hypothetical protein [Magnetospirillum sp.]